MPATAQEFYDGFETLEGGMDSGRAPELIGQNQVSYAVNTTFRGNRPVQRPAFVEPTIGFDSTDSQSWFTWYRIQSAGYFNIDGRTPRMIVSVGGKIFEKSVTGRRAYIHDITPTFPKASTDIAGAPRGGLVDRNSMRQPQAWMQQAATYFVIQDGLSGPIIYDGALARRAGPTEVPVGTCMAFGFGRIIVADGNSFLVGDIEGGPTTVVSFTETTYLNEGGDFSLPAEMGNIVGMKFIARQDISTGQGNLLVFAERGVASVDLSGPRTSWKSSAIQQIALIDIGATSAGSIVSINDDLLFRSSDGIRSYRNSQSQFGMFPAYSAGGNWGRTPISYEISRILDYDTPALLKFVSSVFFDNRLLMTVSPMPNEQGAIFRGMAVMDFTPVTSTRNQVPACFDGLWTGIQPVALLTGNYPEGDRCFAFCTDDTMGNQVWEITKKGVLDNNVCPIESVVETRGFSFSDANRYKNLQRGSISISDLQGQTNFALSFKPDQYPFWVPWCQFTDGLPNVTCTQPVCTPVPMIPPQFRPGILLPSVPETCDPNGPRDMLKKGFTFMVRIVWQGRAALTRLLLESTDTPQLREACRQLVALPAGPAAPALVPKPSALQPPVVSDGAVMVEVAALSIENGSLQFDPGSPDSGNDSGSNLFNYQILTTGSPFLYSATGLPPGLTINTATGVISGKIRYSNYPFLAPGTGIQKTYSIALSAEDASGAVATGTLALNVSNGPLMVVFSTGPLYGSTPPPGLATFQVSVDGGAYGPITLGTTYTANSQLKFKTSVPATTTSGGSTSVAGLFATFSQPEILNGLISTTLTGQVTGGLPGSGATVYYNVNNSTGYYGASAANIEYTSNYTDTHSYPLLPINLSESTNSSLWPEGFGTWYQGIYVGYGSGVTLGPTVIETIINI